jgi:hypothetical protein
MVIGPIDSVKCKQYGTGAIVSYTQVSTDSVWRKIEQSTTQTFPGNPFATPIEYVGNTVAQHSDTLTMVVNTNVTWIRIVSYSDSLGASPIDTTFPVVMVRPPQIVTYSLTPTVDGFKSNVQYDPGNTFVKIKGTYALDAAFQNQSVFVNDTTFSIGNILIQMDSVNAGVSNYTLYWKFEVTQFDGTTDIEIDSVVTSVAPAPPYAGWVGGCTPTNNSISHTVLLDSYGVSGTMKVHIQLSGSTTLLDSIVTTTGAVVGAQQHAINFSSLSSQTWYDLSGTFTTSYGTASFPLVSCMTLAAPSVLEFMIDTVIVTTDIDADVSYTNASGHTCSITIGYGMFGSSVLMYSASYPNQSGNGSFTSSFVLPPSTGKYTMKMQGYDETTFQMDEDTMSFMVSSLTNTFNQELTSPYSLMTKIKVYDVLGKLVYEEHLDKLVPRLNPKYSELKEGNVYLVLAYNKFDQIAYKGKLPFILKK